MKESIASVRTHIPVLGKLARMRQMQGKASRLDVGLAAFSERITKRVTKRAIGQWRRFSLEYVMDEEKETQAPARGDVYNNLDLDVLINLRAGETRAQTAPEAVQQHIESIIERRLTRLQPEVLMRRYDIHHPARNLLYAAPVHAAAEPAARRQGASPRAAVQSGAQGQTGSGVLLETVLHRMQQKETQRLTREVVRQTAAEEIRTVLVREGSEERQKSAAQAREKAPLMRGAQRTILRQVMQAAQPGAAVHAVREPAAGASVQRFAQEQMRLTQQAEVAENAPMQRAGEVLRQMHTMVGARQMPVAMRAENMRAAMGQKVREAAQRMNAAAQQPAKETGNERLAREIRMRSRLGYEQLVHTQGEAAAESAPGAPAAETRTEPAQQRPERTREARTAVLWNVLERSTERMLGSVVNLTAQAGQEGRRERAVQRTNAPAARMMQPVRPGTATPGQAQPSPERGADRAHRTQVMQEVLQRTTERMLGSVESGAISRLSREEPETAQTRLMKKVEQQRRFGYEALVHEAAPQGAEAPASDGGLETTYETVIERTAYSADSAQVLREVLERTTERVLSGAERIQLTQRYGQAAQSTTERERLIRQIEQRTQFGYETTVRENAPQGAAAAEAQKAEETVIERTMQTTAERERRTQVLREVLQRTTERMLGSAESGAISRLSREEPETAQTRLMKKVEQQRRFGYEALVHETAPQSAEAPVSENRQETTYETVIERTAHSAGSAQVLREVLQRTTERMVRNVEQQLSGRDGADGRDGRSGVERIQLTQRYGQAAQPKTERERLMRQIEQRTRFGYETLVHEAAPQGAEAPASDNRQETTYETVIERTAHSAGSAQVLREVLQRTTERMVRNTEQLYGRDGAQGGRGIAGADGRDGQSASAAGTVRVNVQNWQLTQRYGQAEQPTTERERLMRQIEQRTRFGYETLVHETAAQDAEGAVQEAQRAAEPVIERTMERERSAQVLREVLQRTTERMVRSVEQYYGRDGAQGRRGIAGADGRDGQSASAAGTIRVNVQNLQLTQRYGQAAQPTTERERLMRQIEQRTRFGYETLVHESAPQDAESAVQAAPAQDIETVRILRSDAQRMQVFRSVLERAAERAGAQLMQAEDAQGRNAATRYGRRQAPRQAAERLKYDVEMRRRFGLSELQYADDGGQAQPILTDQADARRQEADDRQPQVSAGSVRSVIRRTVQAVAGREAMLASPAMVTAMQSVMKAPKTRARTLKTAVEGQVGMTMLMKQKNNAPQRSTLEMIAMAGEGTSPLRSSILTQPAEIVMFVPPTTMSMYGSAAPKVGNLTWDQTPKQEDRGSAQAALRLMQKAQQKFGSAARYRPPEMVMKEQGDATGRLASQQMGQPANINQQMRAKKTVIKENSAQELSTAEITRIVDKVYDKIERKIATEYRRRGR